MHELWVIGRLERRRILVKLKEGQLVEIKMSNHTHIGQIGTVDMVLKNSAGIPSAVLVKMADGFSDWFFGVKENLVVISIDWKEEGF